MRAPKLILLAAPLAALAAPAGAQWYDGARPLYNAPSPPYGYGSPSRPLPRDVIIDRLEEQGFDEVGRPRFDGDVYTVEAVSPAGNRVRLVIDAYRGVILRRASLGRGFDFEDDSLDPPPARSARRYAPDEMPNAPRFRDDPRLGSIEPGDGRLVAPAPVEAVPLAPPPGSGRPADPRLTPDAPTVTRAPGSAATPIAPGGPGAAPLSERPQREASRPTQPDARPSSPAPGGVYGVNPDRPRGGADAKPATAARPAPKPAAKPASPSSPPASASTPSPEPTTTADAGPRKPVRVIEGVTPMNGGAQSTPAPQNGLQSTPPKP